MSLVNLMLIIAYLVLSVIVTWACLRLLRMANPSEDEGARDPRHASDPVIDLRKCRRAGESVECD